MKIVVKSAHFDVSYTVEEGEKEVHTERNGDPGTPGTPDIITIQEIEWIDEYGDGIDVKSLIDELGMMEEVETAVYEKRE